MQLTTIVERAKIAHLVARLIRNNAPWIALVIVVVLFSNLVPGFLSVTNFMSVLNSASIVGLVGIGLAIVILAGGFDMSVAAIMLVASIIFGTLFMKLGMSVGVAVPVTLLAAVGLGLVNGLVVTRVKLPAFIATFATMFVFTGLSLAIGKGMPIYNIRGPIFSFLGKGMVGVVPMPAIIFIVAAIAAYLVLGRTSFGRAIYAVGGNEKAAHMSGINVDRTRLITYLISGALSGVAGLIYTSRLEMANVLAVTVAGFATAILDAIAAVMIGGISIFGGEGKIYGLIGGILLIYVLTNGMAILGLGDVAHMLAKGLLIVLAVSMDIYFRKVRLLKQQG